MHNNLLNFSVENNWKIDFKEIDHAITEGKDYDYTTLNGTTLNVKADRKGSKTVANWFSSKTKGKGHCTGCLVMTDLLPDNLNFAVEGIFSILNSNTYHNTLVVAQGHRATRNNWWIGGKRIWGVPIGYPIAVGCFNMDEAEVNSKYEDIRKRLHDFIDKIFDKLTTLNVANAEEVSSYCNTLITDAENVIRNSYLQVLEITASELTSFLESLKELIKELIAIFIEGLKNTVEAMIDAVLKWLEDQLHNAVNKVFDNATVQKVLCKIISILNCRFVVITPLSNSANGFNLKVLKFLNQ